MKSFATAIAAVSAFALPVAALSQSDTTLTRAQVRAELQQLEQAGYDPAKGEDPNYPTNIQTAEVRVSSQNGATAYGGTTPGSTASGSRSVSRPASTDEMKQLYFGGP
ncbi:membrane protein [Caballeronia arvi]|uniref:Membrane protein n=1 Tax=Caballeronia arvi TaxID=1777135 RepID=A0A158L2U7_9BURK|nr:DUF4148 domain-containing protein [Caballeronia arvi]SAL87706.1 membrane protein [Caballeronia arvi]